MQTRLRDFSSFSTGLLADLEMSEQRQNKVSDSPFVPALKSDTRGFVCENQVSAIRRHVQRVVGLFVVVCNLYMHLLLE